MNSLEIKLKIWRKTNAFLRKPTQQHWRSQKI